MKQSRTGRCDKDALLLYYYAELNEQQQLAVKEHIDACESCGRDWAQLKKTLDAVVPPRIQMDSSEIFKFSNRVAQRARRRDRSHVWLWGGALTACAVLVLSLVVPQGRLSIPNHGRETDVAMVRDLDLLQHLELLQELELLQGLEGQG